MRSMQDFAQGTPRIFPLAFKNEQIKNCEGIDKCYQDIFPLMFVSGEVRKILLRQFQWVCPIDFYQRFTKEYSQKTQGAPETGSIALQ